MGMYDELYCDAALPDHETLLGTCFQTKSFPDPCLCRYRITDAGRLVDFCGHDLEASGHVTFYTLDTPEGAWELTDRAHELILYRAEFSSGQLLGILRIDESDDDGIRRGLASFRWFRPRSFLFGYPDDSSESRAR